MKENSGRYIFGVCKVGEKGQIVIPKEAREVFDIKPGDSLLMLGDINQGGLALIKTEIFQAVADSILNKKDE
ncbi:MAG TPA: AbrB/MazE/SpoVT family DNA-binding domain-containing protein [Clostridia bacterium]